MPALQMLFYSQRDILIKFVTGNEWRRETDRLWGGNGVFP